jgi:hypothetical protein
MPKPKRRKEIVLFALDVIFFVAALVPSMPVAIRWSLWFVCWAVTVVLVQIHFEWPQNTKRKIVVVIIAIVLFGASFQSLARTQWRKEKSEALRGELVAVDDDRDHSSEPPVIQVGDSLVTFTWTGDASDPTFFNANGDKIRLRRVGNKLLFSTTIKDLHDNLIVEIKDNHWHVSPEKSSCWDKNYTDDSLEVKDGRGRVVLQVRVLPNKIKLQAEWPLMDSSLVQQHKYTKEDGIIPRFKYPSDDYWGELDPNGGYED